MTGTLTNSLDLVWDLARERPTLGGALVLRQEGELLARVQRQAGITLHLISDESDPAVVAKLSAVAFRSSEFAFRLTDETPPSEVWPTPEARRNPAFSHFSFARVTELHRQHGFVPRLQWNRRIQQQARAVRARFSGQLICLHLRSVAPFTVAESNADGIAWNEFLAAHANAGTVDFLLLGDDPLPSGLQLRPGVARAADLGPDLATQLALVSCASGFLGMASGLCTAANFSATPHVIFKHPAHHRAEMQRELGAADGFPFAGKNQRLWRREATLEALHEAFALISP